VVFTGDLLKKEVTERLEVVCVSLLGDVETSRVRTPVINTILGFQDS